MKRVLGSLVLVGALALSSALSAGQPARGSGASSPTPDAAIWGNKWGPPPEAASTTRNHGHNIQVIHETGSRTDRQPGFVDVLKDLLRKLGPVAEAAIWG